MSDPVALVDRYLQLCEDREVEAATALLSPSVRMQFPRGEEYRSLGELVAAPKVYSWVRKHRDRYLVGRADNSTVVTSIGRLYGERLNGTPFDGIRYVDVFVLKDGLIAEQLVWNDLSESGFHSPTSPTTDGTEPEAPPRLSTGAHIDEPPIVAPNSETRPALHPSDPKELS